MNTAQIIARYPEHIVAAVMARYPHGVPAALPKPPAPKSPRFAKLEQIKARRVRVQSLHRQGLSVREIAIRVCATTNMVWNDHKVLGLRPVEKRAASYSRNMAARIWERRVKVYRLFQSGRKVSYIRAILGAGKSTIEADIRYIRDNPEQFRRVAA